MSIIQESPNTGSDLSPQEEIIETKPTAMQRPDSPHGFGVMMCTFTLLGSRLGGGIVGIPGASKVIGFGVLQGMMTYIAFTVMTSLWFLLRVEEITGQTTYPNIGIELYGKWSFYYINSILMLGQ
jgi:amino acid permease